MLQRKQTLFLLASIVVSIVCLSLPLGAIEPKGMGEWTMVYALFTKGGSLDYCVWPLFAIMLISYPFAIAAIALFKNRKLQAKLCVGAIAINLAWYAFYIYSVFTHFNQDGAFHIKFAAGLPLIAIILYLLARKGILDDERLVRSADRIR